MNFFQELQERGIVKDLSDSSIASILNSEKVPFYTGYDPTAKSLQLGNLFMIVTMRRLQMAGHKPYILVGGATGMIGDPSGKSSERTLLDSCTVEANTNAIKKQLERFLDFGTGPSGAVMVNNMDWFKDISFIDYMRTVVKFFRVGEMLAKDSVQSRISSESGISFTEFAYQTLQAYDFAYLNKNFDVKLQIGGSDQWGNITAGIDYTRKTSGKQVFGMVIPLVTDGNGQKLGKSEEGGVYLDADVTSPYRMYQFLLNSEDSHVIQYLKYFSFLSLEEIFKLEESVKNSPEKREAQKVLAETVTELVHGKQALEFVKKATSIFFGGLIEKVSAQEISEIFKDMPSEVKPLSAIKNGISILDFTSESFLFKSRGEFRRAMQQNGVYLNNKSIASPDLIITERDLLNGNILVFRKGKKNYYLVKFE